MRTNCDLWPVQWKFILHMHLKTMQKQKLRGIDMGWLKKSLPYKLKKIYKKVKMISQRTENLVHVQQYHGKYFYKKFFMILLYTADMTIYMSNFDSFDIDQISSKFVQRYIETLL